MEPDKTLAETPAEPPAEVDPPIPAVADQPAAVSGTRADQPLVALSAPAAPASVTSRPTAVESAPSTEVAGSDSTLGPTGDREPVTGERLASAELPGLPTSTESAPEPAAAPDPSEEQANLARVAATSAPSAQGSAIEADARFSIQLISFRSLESLARFAEEEGLLGKAFKLQTDAQGARWHPVLLGAYADRTAAESALANLPARLRRLDPIIRPLAPDERLVPIASR